MKKLVTSFVILFTSCLIGYSQYIIGGSFSFSSTAEKSSLGEEDEYVIVYNDFSFNPKVGYFLSEDLLVGGILSLSRDAVRTDTDPEQLQVNSGVGFFPFVRYYALRMNKFSAFAEGRAGVDFGSSFEEVGNTTTDGPKYRSLSLSASPGISYELSERVNLEAYINGLSFNASVATEITELTDGLEVKDRSRNFSFGANAGNIVSVSGFTIGAIIKL